MARRTGARPGPSGSAGPDAQSGPPETSARLVVVAPRSLAAAAAWAGGVVVALGAAYVAREALAWIVIAAIFALGLNPAVAALERRGLGRGSAATVVFLLATAGLALALARIVPPLVEQVTALVRSLPGLARDLAHGRGSLGFLESDYHLVERVRRATAGHGAGEILGSSGPALHVVRSAAQTAGGFVAVAFIAYFMLRDGQSWLAAARSAVPDSGHPSWDRVTRGIADAVGGYVTGNLLISVIAGAYATAVLLILGVPYAVPLGLIVAILDLVPAIGATLAAAVVGTVALAAQGIVPAAIVVAALVVYQQIENHALQPLVYARTADLSPLAVAVALLIGADVGGLLGVLAAVPVASSLKVLARELLLRRDQRRLAHTDPSTLAAPEAERPRPTHLEASDGTPH